MKEKTNNRSIIIAVFLLFIIILIGNFKTGNFSIKDIGNYNINLELTFGIIIGILASIVIIKQR